MKRSIIASLVFVLFATFSLASVHAADPPKKTAPSSSPSLASGTLPKSMQSPSTVTAIAPSLPVAEGNKIDQGTVTPTSGPCRDFNDEGPAIPPVRKSAGWSCPPGYDCDDFDTGLGGRCAWEGHSTLTADSPFCKWQLCRPY